MKYFTLLQLNKSIQKLIHGIQKDFWITAELAQFQLREHAYLEFVQKDENRIVAKARGLIWADTFEKLYESLGDGIFEILKEGSEVLVQVRVTYHEVHGISLMVLDLDEKFTIGSLELKRRETLEKLEKEQLLALQKQINLAVVPQRLAIISSKEAAGFTDFMNQLENNSWNFIFHTTIFEAGVQGQRAVSEIINQLNKINLKDFDAVIIIRGGGSRLDLEAFNDYELAKAIAVHKLPVLTGIGHQRDESVCDIVANAALKTPTAVAEFLIQRALTYWNEIATFYQEITQLTSNKLSNEKSFLKDLKNDISRLGNKTLQQKQRGIAGLELEISKELKYRLKSENQKLESLERQVIQLDPQNLLNRGYSITLKNNKPVINGDEVQVGDEIESVLKDGKIISKVLATNGKKRN
ncbi:exodeoxyribonuclease VII large subunit [Chondrinema litorale]|uniref:exodeoxyribonuclease VII large subunit n=1 Tax=Chondrinema litorale TaxID=2994555 RepID=UPI00254431A9|nr:exodeoxyribonuclease VII large subunit [Chondrinema litorale]UZR94279.1 exodeoxyribonuclease VII large subunit [Chondrinema litorale]